MLKVAFKTQNLKTPPLVNSQTSGCVLHVENLLGPLRKYYQKSHENPKKYFSKLLKPLRKTV